jgi:hypothetical protein
MEFTSEITGTDTVSFVAVEARRLPPLVIADHGKVRLGGQGPIFRNPAISDDGKVRLGGQGPIFRNPAIADSGKVRLGGQGPIFR